MFKQVSFSGGMNHIWNQKQLKVHKTAQNFITWWNEPFEAKMAKSALKHIKTAQNTKSFTCWANWPIWSKKCLIHLKTAENIKSFIFWWNEPNLKPKTANALKTHQNCPKHQKCHLLVKLSHLKQKSA